MKTRLADIARWASRLPGATITQAQARAAVLKAKAEREAKAAE